MFQADVEAKRLLDTVIYAFAIGSGGNRAQRDSRAEHTQMSSRKPSLHYLHTPETEFADAGVVQYESGDGSVGITDE